MADVDVTREQALRAHAAATDAFVDLVRTMPIDPAPVRHLRWSTIEVAAHVLSMQRALLQMVHGNGGWRTLSDAAAENERLLAATREGRPGEIARALGVAAPALREAWATRPGEVVGWHAGTKAPIEAVIGASAADILVHGWDIARALGRPWTITSEAALVASAGALILAPPFLAEHASRVELTFVIDLRSGTPYTATFANGGLAVESGRPERADCTISADPVAFLLVGAGRTSRWRAVLTGKIRASGRRPWAALQFTSLIDWP